MSELAKLTIYLLFVQHTVVLFNIATEDLVKRAIDIVWSNKLASLKDRFSQMESRVSQSLQAAEKRLDKRWDRSSFDERMKKLREKMDDFRNKMREKMKEIAATTANISTIHINANNGQTQVGVNNLK